MLFLKTNFSRKCVCFLSCFYLLFFLRNLSLINELFGIWIRPETVPDYFKSTLRSLYIISTVDHNNLTTRVRYTTVCIPLHTLLCYSTRDMVYNSGYIHRGCDYNYHVILSHTADDIARENVLGDDPQ